MRIAFILLVGIHGIIHLFGFLKAFDFIEFKALTQSISKPMGIIWLIAFCLFIITTILIIFKSSYWWLFGITAVLISQLLIILFWHDAKFATILNILILIVSIMAFSNFNFKKNLISERALMHSKIELNSNNTDLDKARENLPIIVQKWLHYSGIQKNHLIKSIYLEQEALMKMKPNQKEWYKANAEQNFTTKPPAFNWSVNLSMNPFMNIVGRDKFDDGKGEMLIKLWSIFPIVNAKENKKINQAALQRFLAEIVWFPTAALNPYISWEKIDEKSAKATMNYNGTSGSGVFYFSENGEFLKFSTMRYKDLEKDSKLIEWTVEVIKTKEFNSFKIPCELKATWKLEDGDWTWLQLKITDIKYNICKI